MTPGRVRACAASESETIVKHADGGRYLLFDVIKMRINEEWHEGVLYVSMADDKLYARTMDDFCSRFEEDA